MIKVLDKSVADKIAAGEVIDRPVSIIKELLENSLDAGATNITVEILNGGKSYIRVTDNGCGIQPDELELAFKRHATSKISSVEDLDSIITLGFRGEALASICAVSRVEVITKTINNRTGRHLIIEDSTVIENSPIGCPEGTTVTVRDLFYNVPARKKFLASDSSETRKIIDMVSRVALSYGDVRFNLINSKQKVFSTQGNGNIYNNIINIFGAEIGKDLLPVEVNKPGYILKGFVSAPSNSSPNRSKQVFCINGRVVSSKTLENALDKAYKEKLFSGRFPIAFLFLSMPPEKLDVNVHPTKKEVRFDDPYEITDFVADAVRCALNVKEAIPQIKIKQPLSEEFHQESIQETIKVEEFQPEISTKTYREEKVDDDKQVDIKKILTTIERSDEDFKLVIDEPDQTPFLISSLNYIGIIFKSYILAHDYNDFYIIDQHAAHERVFYEHLLTLYNEREKATQILLTPFTINVPAQVSATEDLWLNQIINLGYNIEDFGNNTYIIREIPAFMSLSEAKDFLDDVIKDLEDKPDLSNKNILNKIISRACKSAVKAGDELKPEEVSELFSSLSKCINPFSCPHGRPTFIKMTKYEIERLFKRV